MMSAQDRPELELLTIAEVAQIWRVSKRTVERRIAAGELPVVRLFGGRSVRVRADVALRLNDTQET